MATNGGEKTPLPDAGGDLFSGCRVLVVDDSKPMRLFIQRLLEVSGAVVVVAEDGGAALELAAKSRYDLLLIDVEMPGIDGCEVAQTLKNQGLATPLIAVTAHTNQADLEHCLASGFDACLSKPFSKDSLKTVVLPLLVR